MHLRYFDYDRFCGYLCVANCSKDLFLQSTRGRAIATIHLIADKERSRKPLFTPSDAYALGSVLRADS